MKKERTLTVSSLYYQKPSPSGNPFLLSRRSEKPLIRLNGLWLSEAGFNPQDKVKVLVAEDKLVIEKLPAGDTAAV